MLKGELGAEMASPTSTRRSQEFRLGRATRQRAPAQQGLQRCPAAHGDQNTLDDLGGHRHGR